MARWISSAVLFTVVGLLLFSVDPNIPLRVLMTRYGFWLAGAWAVGLVAVVSLGPWALRTSRLASLFAALDHWILTAVVVSPDGSSSGGIFGRAADGALPSEVHAKLCKRYPKATEPMERSWSRLGRRLNAAVTILLTVGLGLVFQFTLGQKFPDLLEFHAPPFDQWLIRCALGWWLPAVLAVVALGFAAGSERVRYQRVFVENLSGDVEDE